MEDNEINQELALELLAGAGILVFLIQWLPSWSILGLASLLVLDAVLLAAILLVVHDRDYS